MEQLVGELWIACALGRCFPHRGSSGGWYMV